MSTDVANGHHRRTSSVTRRSPVVAAKMQALELCFSSKTPTTAATAAKAPATAAAVVVPRAVEAVDTEPAEVEDEDAEQLATVGRPEYYGAVEPDTEEQHDDDDDVASDVSNGDDAVHSDGEQGDNNDNDDRYSDEEFDAELADDVSTEESPDCAETEPAVATVDGLQKKPMTGYDVLQARKAAAAAAATAAAAAAAAASGGQSPKARTGRRGSHLRAPSNIPTPTAQEAARYASELNKFAEVEFSSGKKIAVLETGADLVSVAAVTF
jgi:hypothetical protein